MAKQKELRFYGHMFDLRTLAGARAVELQFVSQQNGQVVVTIPLELLPQVAARISRELEKDSVQLALSSKA